MQTSDHYNQLSCSNIAIYHHLLQCNLHNAFMYDSGRRPWGRRQLTAEVSECDCQDPVYENLTCFLTDSLADLYMHCVIWHFRAIQVMTISGGDLLTSQKRVMNLTSHDVLYSVSIMTMTVTEVQFTGNYTFRLCFQILYMYGNCIVLLYFLLYFMGLLKQCVDWLGSVSLTLS